MAMNAVAQPIQMKNSGSPAVSQAAEQRAGKYLIFEVANEEFGISVLKVKEIMKMQQVTTVPQTPAFILGVINLRGRIVPVVSLRSKFNMAEQEHTDRTCIVVVRVDTPAGEQPMGIIVDGVVEVLLVSPDDIEDTPDFGRDVTTSYVRGIAKSKGKVKILIDIDRVLESQELGGLTSMGM
jgi:purine-binding chemotaxis protein CheW